MYLKPRTAVVRRARHRLEAVVEPLHVGGADVLEVLEQPEQPAEWSAVVAAGDRLAISLSRKRHDHDAAAPCRRSPVLHCQRRKADPLGAVWRIHI